MAAWPTGLKTLYSLEVLTSREHGVVSASFLVSSVDVYGVGKAGLLSLKGVSFPVCNCNITVLI